MHDIYTSCTVSQSFSTPTGTKERCLCLSYTAPLQDFVAVLGTFQNIAHRPACLLYITRQPMRKCRMGDLCVTLRVSTDLVEVGDLGFDYGPS